MVHNEIGGDVIGEVWRAQEASKEIIYFRTSNEDNWFRIEYTGPLMLERAAFMTQKLKDAASMSGGIEVGIDYDLMTVGDPPHTNQTTFNLVSYIQVRG